MEKLQNFIKSLEAKDCTLSISPQAISKLVADKDSTNPHRNLLWTTDPTVELPIIRTKHGLGSENPLTIMDLWQIALAKDAQAPALSYKLEGNWLSLTLQQYYEECIRFGCAVVKENITERTGLSILSYNNKEWFFSYNGGVFANLIATGLYITNKPKLCEYVLQDCNSEICVVENQDQLNKILVSWGNLPKLRKVVVIEEEFTLGEFTQYKDQVVSYKQFVDFEITDQIMDGLIARMKKQSPGHCCSLVYTSGTTGSPKGVMLSHDNYTWPAISTAERLPFKEPNPRFISYLPLSHVAAQCIDIVLSLAMGAHVFFTDSNALKGTLIDYLLHVKPNIFFGVPRVFEKMEEKAMATLSQKPRIYRWAYDAGTKGMDLKMKGQDPGFWFKLYDLLVFRTLKKKLGLQNAEYLLFGAAPMPDHTRKFFFAMSMFLNNCFGMSETAGAASALQPVDYPDYHLASAGKAIPGTEITIEKENGEICFFGRHVFMGYLNNEEATVKALDHSRRLHSGDKGKLDDKGNMFITGRLKELLVTAGGENVAPVPVENMVKEQCPFLSNVMLIGDKRKFISALLTFRVTSLAMDLPNRELAPEAVGILEKKGVKGLSTVDEAASNPEVLKLIQKGIDVVNNNVVSRAAQIRKWKIILDDFSIPGGELTPTLKLRRKIVLDKYNKVIEGIYHTPGL